MIGYLADKSGSQPMDGSTPAFSVFTGLPFCEPHLSGTAAGPGFGPEVPKIEIDLMDGEFSRQPMRGHSKSTWTD